jgi:hypothetical protein
MSEPQLWITGPSGAWFMPQRKVTPPIRRGTARRLGLTKPEPVVTVFINPDISVFQRNMREALSVRALLANYEANRRVIEEAFRRFSSTIGAARPEETP